MLQRHCGFERAFDHLCRSEMLFIPEDFRLMDFSVRWSSRVLAVYQSDLSYLEEQGVLVSSLGLISADKQYRYFDLLASTVVMSCMESGYDILDAIDIGLIVADELECLAEKIPGIEISVNNLEEIVFEVLSDENLVRTSAVPNIEPQLISTKVAIDTVNMSSRCMELKSKRHSEPLSLSAVDFAN